jgi:hypothetical protein
VNVPPQIASIVSLVSIASAGIAGAPKHCQHLRPPGAEAVFTGRLTVQRFAGPPNFESTARGDAEERSFILHLQRPSCADDGEFIDASTSFHRVQVSASAKGMLTRLKRAVGHTVTITGKAFGAHTGHHHAPLVLLADHVTVR